MNLSGIKHKLTPEQYIFFTKITNLLNGRIHFFGSICRRDFTVGSSDIDVQFFSENSQSDLLLLSHFLQENKVSFSSDFFKSDTDPLHTVSGFKYTIKMPFKSDILVVDIKNEHILTLRNNRALNMPFIYLLILKILKFGLKLSLISRDTFFSLKSIIWNHHDDLTIHEQHFKIMTESEYNTFFNESVNKTNLMHPSCYPKFIVFYE